MDFNEEKYDLWLRHEVIDAIIFSMHDLKDHYHSSVPTSSHNGSNNQKTAVTPSDLNKIRILNSDDLPVNNIHDLPQTNIYQIQNSNHSNHFNNNSNQLPSIYKDTSLQRLENRVRSGSGENTQEMTKVGTFLQLTKEFKKLYAHFFVYRIFVMIE